MHRSKRRRQPRLGKSIDAVDWIAELRQAPDLSTLPVGRRVVVIGGGMTAVDAAVQSKRLGAETVTIAYRRGVTDMKASEYERELAQTSGVTIRPWARPIPLEGHGGAVSGVLFERTKLENGKLVGTGEAFRIEADVVFTAIGQTPRAAFSAPRRLSSKMGVSSSRRAQDFAERRLGGRRLRRRRPRPHGQRGRGRQAGRPLDHRRTQD